MHFENGPWVHCTVSWVQYLGSGFCVSVLMTRPRLDTKPGVQTKVPPLMIYFINPLLRHYPDHQWERGHLTSQFSPGVIKHQRFIFMMQYGRLEGLKSDHHDHQILIIKWSSSSSMIVGVNKWYNEKTAQQPDRQSEKNKSSLKLAFYLWNWCFAFYFIKSVMKTSLKWNSLANVNSEQTTTKVFPYFQLTFILQFN